MLKLNTGPKEFNYLMARHLPPFREGEGEDFHSRGHVHQNCKLNLGNLRLHSVTSVTMDVFNISSS